MRNSPLSLCPAGRLDMSTDLLKKIKSSQTDEKGTGRKAKGERVATANDTRFSETNCLAW